MASISASSRFCSGTRSWQNTALHQGRDPNGTAISPLDKLDVPGRRGRTHRLRRCAFEAADIFRAASAPLIGATMPTPEPSAAQGHVGDLRCRTAALGGHVEACGDCGHQRIAYNSCRNRHCPKCQGAAAHPAGRARLTWLPLDIMHVVFSIPAVKSPTSLSTTKYCDDLLFRAASRSRATIAADRRHLGARIGITAVLHTWGSAMTYHPHVHMIVPGGGIARDGTRWVSSRPAFLLPVRVLSKLFRRLFLTRLPELQRNGQLAFFGDHARLREQNASCVSSHLCGRRTGWSTQLHYLRARGGARLSAATRTASPSKPPVDLLDESASPFRYKDYRRDGAERYRTMTLTTDEFILGVSCCTFCREGFSPHFTILACQRHPQGQCRPRPTTARGAAGRSQMNWSN